MLRTVLLAVAAAGVILGTGYKVICVAPPIERALQQETPSWWPGDAPPWWLAPIPAQRTEAGGIQPIADPFALVLKAEDWVADDAEGARMQLQRRYRMPVLDAPIEQDRRMAFAPDASVDYPMPVIIPESGIYPPKDLTPAAPEYAPSPRVMVVKPRRP